MNIYVFFLLSLMFAGICAGLVGLGYKMGTNVRIIEIASNETARVMQVPKQAYEPDEEAGVPGDEEYVRIN